MNTQTHPPQQAAKAAPLGLSYHWFLLAYGTAVVATALPRPEWPVLFAPLAGPWAGFLYGHSCCTMADAMPSPSAVVSVAFLPAILIAFRWSHRKLAGTVLLIWFVAWAALAWLSVINSTS